MSNDYDFGYGDASEDPGPDYAADRQAAATKICSKCGQEKGIGDFTRMAQSRDGHRPDCRECNRQAQRASRAADPEKVRVALRAQYAANPEKHKARKRDYAQANPDRIRAKSRRYYEANADTIRAKTRRWNRENPDKAKALRHIRRAREVNAPGYFTPAEWRALCAHYGYMCLCCGAKEPDIKLTPDHVIPLARGGSNDIGNIQPLCLLCNDRKHTRTTDYRALGDARAALAVLKTMAAEAPALQPGTEAGT